MTTETGYGTVAVMRRMNARWQLCVVGVAVLILSAGSASGMNLYAYDLDSLIYMSTEVIEGTLGQGADSVTVTRVHKGQFSVGDTVALEAMDFFRKGSFMESRRLEAGDEVTLFLVRATAQFLYDIPEGAEIYWPVPSGVKLHIDNKVLGFRQMSNPGPYLVNRHENALAFAKDPEGFRELLVERMTYVDELTAELARPAAEQSIDWLCELLDQRSKLSAETRQLFGWGDYICKTACAHVANRHDPAEIDRALQIYRDNAATIRYMPWHTGDLLKGFATPTGREFLLAKLADPSVDDAAKLTYAKAVYHAGIVYQSIRYVNLPADAHEPSPEAGANNDWYLTRLAEMIAQPSVAAEVRTELLKAIRLSRHDRRNEEVAKDFTKAAAMLAELFEATTDSGLKYEIEVTLFQADMAAYESLNSSSGPALSRITEVTVAFDDERDEPTLRYSMDGYVLIADAWDGLSLVAQNIETGVKTFLPGSTAILDRRGSRCHYGATGSAPIPADLPPGRYRVYLEFLKDGQVVSTGYAAEIELDLAAIAAEVK